MEKKSDDPRPVPAERPVFGLSRRVWYLLAGCFGLMIFSRLVFPPSSSSLTGHYSTSRGLLTAADYLNASASEPAPFAFCPDFGPDDAVAAKRGQVALLKSRLHLGTGARVQRLIHKAMTGQPVTVSVLGGSITACHGAGDDPVSPRCWPSKFFEWWNGVFPHPLSQLYNGAARLTDSAYFAYCSKHHMPDHADLVILEFDASDPNDPLWMNHFELLVRSILTRPEQPAVILLGHFAPQVLVQNKFTGPEMLHDIVAQFYDVPHISMKGALYADYMSDPEGTRQAYYSDMVLASPAGHDMLADLLISYFQSQICAGWATTMGHAFDVPYMGAGQSSGVNPLLNVDADDLEAQGGGLAAKARAMRVPPARLANRPSDILTFREAEPYCVIANEIVNPIPPSHFFGSGWQTYKPVNEGPEVKAYWWSEVGGSRMRVPIKTSAGDVAIYYLQHPDSTASGRVACWVDDDFGNRVELNGINKNVGQPTPTLTTINEGVEAGDHYVECLVLGKEGAKLPPFKMMGVFAT
ncbi:hypothetical protein CC85DRAFT_286107 [Cutaneotrichosporon oleaginosum]|uniref:Capsular associated protein n=1 Tax=Cutaneotrichosporon oleaginosum TaxID=879819 RepID=A0A0J0XLA3_9TREE|nr:uncharacterized protein CC85DRAFT_286107 [Cutaneotrichosporon oleaginosum]KLT41867.1 hypothetical protein CC85DRAFT_286107 [Cutaneotrichosporon oleaginosum]